MRYLTALPAIALALVGSGPVAAAQPPPGDGPHVYSEKHCQTWQPVNEPYKITVCAAAQWTNRAKKGMIIQSFRLSSPRCRHLEKHEAFKDVYAAFNYRGTYYVAGGCPHLYPVQVHRVILKNKANVFIKTKVAVDMDFDRTVKFGFFICRSHGC